jgi:hypothetical protein
MVKVPEAAVFVGVIVYVPLNVGAIAGDPGAVGDFTFLQPAKAITKKSNTVTAGIKIVFFFILKLLFSGDNNAVYRAV